MISKSRLLALILLAAFLTFFWENPLMIFLKVFVVYLHELSHALGALLTGGRVVEIVIQWNESGFTRTRGGNFLITASSGYIGSIAWGLLMLHASLSGKFYKTLSMLVGFILIISALFFFTIRSEFFYYFSLAWGFLLLLIPIFIPSVTRALLFFLGGLTSLYAVYDLGDFFRGDILNTDAGIIAQHYLHDEFSILIGAYAIGISITLTSLWLVYAVTLNALHAEEDFIDEEYDNKDEE